MARQFTFFDSSDSIHSLARSLQEYGIGGSMRLYAHNEIYNFGVSETHIPAALLSPYEIIEIEESKKDRIFRRIAPSDSKGRRPSVAIDYVHRFRKNPATFRGACSERGITRSLDYCQPLWCGNTEEGERCRLSGCPCVRCERYYDSAGAVSEPAGGVPAL